MPQPPPPRTPSLLFIPACSAAERSWTSSNGSSATARSPWKSAWEQLRSSKAASPSYSPKPVANVVRGPYNNPHIGSVEMANDSAAAYTHALAWSLNGSREHSTKAIEILNAWSATLESVAGHDAKLLIGMMGVRFCNAAELLRHSEAEWLAADQERFERMLRQIFYPGIQDFYPTANGNWDASRIQTMLAMGVFLDDRAMFDRAADYFRQGDGNASIQHYFNTFGECQESGRDQAHTQMGVGSQSPARWRGSREWTCTEPPATGSRSVMNTQPNATWAAKCPTSRFAAWLGDITIPRSRQSRGGVFPRSTNWRPTTTTAGWG
jgi:hypothetical protein